MDLLDKLRLVGTRIEAHGDRPLPGATTIEAVLSPTEVVMDGRPTILFGSNNYFGLTHHPEVIEAAKTALDLYGAGTTGSRIANGSYHLHEQLERDFADLYGRREAVVFTTGYQANLGILSGLCGPGDHLLLDAESHASLCDGARLSGANLIWVQHNSPQHLARKLARLPADGKNRLVVVEGLYSIRGDVADIGRTAAICREHQAYLLVDEAHAFGIYGDRGLGCSEDQGVLGEVDFITGTFSKTLGGIGGYCVSDHLEIRMLRFSSRAYMFTASGTAPTIAGARAALAIVGRDRTLRDRLWTNVRRFHRGLTTLGFQTSEVASPLLPIYTGREDVTLAMWEGLLDAGVYVNAVVPPACPGDHCLLRTSCSASHSVGQIDAALDVFARIGRRAGLIPATSQTADRS